MQPGFDPKKTPANKAEKVPDGLASSIKPEGLLEKFGNRGWFRSTEVKEDVLRCAKKLESSGASDAHWSLVNSALHHVQSAPVALKLRLLSNLTELCCDMGRHVPEKIISSCALKKQPASSLSVVVSVLSSINSELKKPAVLADVCKHAERLIDRPSEMANFFSKVLCKAQRGEFTPHNRSYLCPITVCFAETMGWNELGSIRLMEALGLRHPTEDRWHLVIDEVIKANPKDYEKQTPKLPQLLIARDISDEQFSILKLAYERPADEHYPVITKAAYELVREMHRDHTIKNAFIVHQVMLLKDQPEDLLSALKFYHAVIEKRELFREADIALKHLLFRKGRKANQAARVLAEDGPFQVDGPPWRQGSALERKATDACMDLMASLRQMSHGFGSLTMAARRLPDGTPAAIERFGMDIFHSVARINAHDVHGFPGRGWLLSFPETARVLRRDDASALLEDDPFFPYKENWKFLAKVIDIFSKTQVILTRGQMVFVNHDPRFKHQGHQMCMVVANDHYYRYSFEDAYLVPWELISQKILPALVTDLNSESFRSEIEDVNNLGLTTEFLHRETAKRGWPLLNLTWPSNLGGMCNAWPADSSPFFEWEAALKGVVTRTVRFDDWLDGWGHLHKALYDGRYYGEHLPPDFWKLLKPLQDEHHRVLNLGRSYRNIAHLFNLSFSYWQKGYCDGRVTGAILPPLPEKASAAMVTERGNMLSLRLLHEVYRWHQGLSESGADLDYYPILAFGETFNPSAAPSDQLRLDTANLRLEFIIDGSLKSYQLDPDGLGQADSEIWQRFIQPMFADVNLAPYFYHRDVFKDFGY